MRRLLLALVATLVALVGPPVTASAAAPLADINGSRQICFPRWTTPLGGPGPVVRYWICIPLLSVLPPVHPDPCNCPTAIDLGVQAVLPTELGNTVMSNIQTGLTGLGHAAVAGDPNQAAQLHNAAMNSFTTAAALLGGLRLPGARAGFLDLSSGTLMPNPASWQLQAAGYLSNGITLLQQWIATRNPQLWDLIVPQLNNGYNALVN